LSQLVQLIADKTAKTVRSLTKRAVGKGGGREQTVESIQGPILVPDRFQELGSNFSKTFRTKPTANARSAIHVILGSKLYQDSLGLRCETSLGPILG